MLDQIARVIEQQGDALAAAWLADLEARGNVLAAGDNRSQLLHDARTWVTLLLGALRTGDVEPLQRGSRSTARRLALAGLPLSDAVEAVVAFKHALWRSLRSLPDLDSEAAHEATRIVGEWFDSVVAAMVGNYEPCAAADSRSLTVDRALQLSRAAEEQSVISQLAQEMASERDLKRLRDLVVRSAAHLAGAQRAALAAADNGRLRYLSAYQLPLGDLNAYARRVGTPLSGALEPPETRIVNHLADGSDSARARLAGKLDLRCLLSVLLRVGSRTLGVLELYDPLAEQVWSEREARQVLDLAAQAALALDNARLLAEAEDRAQRVSALNEASRALASQLSSPRLLETAVASAARLLRAPQAWLWLRVPATARFELRAAHGRAATRLSRVGFVLAQGLLGEAAEGQARIISPAESRRAPWGKGWAMAAPLQVGARALGLLVVQRGHRAFGGEDLRLLEALAGQVVAAVQNAHLYDESERLGRRLSASITALGDALAASLDMHELLQVIAEHGAELAQAEAAIVFMPDNGALAARATALRGAEVKSAPPAAGDPRAYEPVARLVVERGRPVSASSRGRTTDPQVRRAMAAEGLRAAAAFPLTVRGRPTGALCVLSQARPLRRHERELLASFSRQASVGIENVLLFSETQQRLAELADLSRASAGVTSTLDQAAIVEIIVESVSRALRVPVAAVALLDDNDRLLLPECGHRGLPPGYVRTFAPDTDSIAHAVIADQRIKVIGDMAAEERRDDSLAAGLELGSLICAPVKGREGVLGILFAADRVPRTFRSHEEALLSAYANEAALALQNAFHYEAVVDRARELEGILDATKMMSSTLEVQPVLEHVVRAAASLLGLPVASIMLLDDARHHLITVAACGLPPDHELHRPLRLGQSIPGMVALQGVAMTSTDLLRDGRFDQRSAARKESLLSLISVPMIAKGTTLGVISAYSPAARPFTLTQERLLTTLAGQAAVAMENARLYQEARAQTHSMRVLMQEANHRIKNNLQSIIGIIQLHMDQVGDGRVQDTLREIIGRVQAVAVLHELMLDEDMRAVDVKEASRRILDNALRQNPRPEIAIAGQVSGARVHLPSGQATSLACIINELAYNAVAHAFPGRSSGSVVINLQEATGGRILVQVSDNGVGLPAGFDLGRGARLGLRLVEGLVAQDLGGEFTITSDEGTTCRVMFRR